MGGIAAQVRAFTYLGDAACRTGSGNLQAGIIKASFRALPVNRTHADMARHFGTPTVPALQAARQSPRAGPCDSGGRGRLPGVGCWLPVRLRHRRFFSLAELNAAIRARLDELNELLEERAPAHAPAAHRPVDRPALGPLPFTP